MVLALAVLVAGAAAQNDDPAPLLLPKHVTPEMVKAVKKGLDYLKGAQANDGSYVNTADGTAYPISMAALAGMGFLAGGNTSTRGPYADEVRKVMKYLMRFSTDNGLITGPNEDSGRPMYGHGFALMFLGCLYGMENDRKIRQNMAPIIRKAIRLTSRGQSPLGGWTYYPGGGDEGSVTITQIQALRAAHNAGFVVPRKTIEESIRYLERCKTPDGGIRYSFHSGPHTQIAISAAALATMYNAGEYESDMAKDCLKYVFGKFKGRGGWNIGGHSYYSHLYASQAFYQAGDRYWDEYFPAAAKQLMKLQSADGSWMGDGIGPVFGTAAGVVILQLPYKLLPIYQR